MFGVGLYFRGLPVPMLESDCLMVPVAMRVLRGRMINMVGHCGTGHEQVHFVCGEDEGKQEKFVGFATTSLFNFAGFGSCAIVYRWRSYWEVQGILEKCRSQCCLMNVFRDGSGGDQAVQLAIAEDDFLKQ